VISSRQRVAAAHGAEGNGVVPTRKHLGPPKSKNLGFPFAYRARALSFSRKTFSPGSSNLHFEFEKQNETRASSSRLSSLPIGHAPPLPWPTSPRNPPAKARYEPFRGSSYPISRPFCLFLPRRTPQLAGAVGSSRHSNSISLFSQAHGCGSHPLSFPSREFSPLTSPMNFDPLLFRQF
jgi:hypothetical protein